MYFFQSQQLSQVKNVLHAFHTRWGGLSKGPYSSLNMSLGVNDEPEAVKKNRRRVKRFWGLGSNGLFLPQQVHGDKVFVLRGVRGVNGQWSMVNGKWSMVNGKKERGSGKVEADAVITDIPDLAVGILTADCIPILGVDRKKLVIAAIHAGWRGTLKGIAKKTVQDMVKVFGCSGEDIVFAIGPSIGDCCYEVEIRYLKGIEGDRYLSKRDVRYFFNLRGMNHDQLLSAGIPYKSISHIDICTMCNSGLFFSHRGDGPLTGRQLNFIMIKNRL